MTATQISLTVSAGPVTNPEPLSYELANAIQSISVQVTDQVPCGFQIDFNAERSTTVTADYPVLATDELEPFHRVIIDVAVGSGRTTLIDGIITHQQLTPGDAGRGGTLTVMGEDVSVLMDMIDLPTPFPGMADVEIVAEVLGLWSLIGIAPAIVPPLQPPIVDPEIQVTIQNGTDRAWLGQLAAKYGYYFSVRPGPLPMTNIGHWGPPLRLSMPQPALTVDEGPGTNVESIDFSLDATAPNLILGMAMDPVTDDSIPVATIMSTREPPLATRPALLGYPPFGRKSFYEDSALSNLAAVAQAQGQTDVSTDNVVTVTGTVDTVRYGHVLEAGGLVGVRGAGHSYDGLYYVKSVNHQLRPGAYTQQFTLTREGTGSTVASVTP